jgi:hypothetical protein
VVLFYFSIFCLLIYYLKHFSFFLFATNYNISKNKSFSIFNNFLNFLFKNISSSIIFFKTTILYEMSVYLKLKYITEKPFYSFYSTMNCYYFTYREFLYVKYLHHNKLNRNNYFKYNTPLYIRQLQVLKYLFNISFITIIGVFLFVVSYYYFTIIRYLPISKLLI